MFAENGEGKSFVYAGLCVWAFLVSLPFALLLFPDTVLKVCGNPGLSKPVGSTFPIAFAHFVSLGPITLATFKKFSLLFYLWW